MKKREKMSPVPRVISFTVSTAELIETARNSWNCFGCRETRIDSRIRATAWSVGTAFLDWQTEDDRSHEASEVLPCRLEEVSFVVQHGWVTITYLSALFFWSFRKFFEESTKRFSSSVYDPISARDTLFRLVITFASNSIETLEKSRY